MKKRWFSAQTGYYLHKIRYPFDCFWLFCVQFWAFLGGCGRKAQCAFWGVVVFLLVRILFYVEYTSVYRDFARVSGEPIGIGRELSDDEMKVVPIRFTLFRSGLLSFAFEGGWLPHLVPSKVERIIVNKPLFDEGAAMLPLSERYSAFGGFGALYRTQAVRSWCFTYDMRCEIVRETVRYSFEHPLVDVEYVPRSVNSNCRCAHVSVWSPGAMEAKVKFNARFEYDENGQLRRLELNGGESSTNSQERVRMLGLMPIQEFEIDVFGRCLSERYLDSSGRLCQCPDGYSGWLVRRDDAGREVYRSWNGDNGECWTQCGIASCRRAYLPHWYKERYLDVNERLCAWRSGEAGFNMKLDDVGRKLSCVWIGVDGGATQTLSGIARQKYGYDKRGHCTSVANFDAKGKTCLNWLGVARIEGVYDICGDLAEINYFDTNKVGQEMIALPFCRCVRQNAFATALGLGECAFICRLGDYDVGMAEGKGFPGLPHDHNEGLPWQMTLAKRKIDGSYDMVSVNLSDIASGIVVWEEMVSKDEWKRLLRSCAHYVQ